MTHGRSLRAAIAIAVVVALGLSLIALTRGERGEIARAAAAGPAGQLSIPELSIVSLLTKTSFAVSATNPIGSGGGGAGEATFEPLILQRPVDQHSPALMRAVARGTHLAQAVVSVYRPGTDRTHATYELRDVVITLLQQNGASERLALAYGSIEMTVGQNSECYDVVGNASC